MAREVLEGFGEAAVEALIPALQAESPHTRELAASLLGDLGDPRAVEPLIAATNADEWQVRFAAVEALGQIGDRRALPIIEHLTSDDDPRVSAIARAVVEAMRP
jgi:HEAT repeat protein